MAYGSLAIDTLNASTGVLATQNGMTGIAKAWVNYNGNAQTVTASFNVSSVTYNATGDYTVNFTTAMPNANYIFTASRGGDSGSSDSEFQQTPYSQATQTTTSSRSISTRYGGGTRNASIVSMAYFSS
jgi:hypothetical protein